MNVKRKEAAVKKYAPMLTQGVNPEELTDLIGKDEKNYTADEITEISAAITSAGAEKPQTPATKAKPTTPVAKAKVVKEVPGYEEWRCEIKLTVVEGKVTHREAEKVKKLRPCVKITEEEAETLNNGALHSPRQDFVLMYFKPE